MKKTLLSIAIFGLGLANINAQAPTNGLTVHYKFDETLNDESGNGYNATQVNTPVYSGSGLTNGYDVIDMEASGGVYYDFSSNQSEFQTQNLSYSVWIKFESFPNVYSNIIENGNPNGNTAYFRVLKTNESSMRLEAGYYIASGNSLNVSTSSFAQEDILNEWHLYTFTSEISGNQRISKIYLDTTLISNLGTTVATQMTIEYDSGTNLNIGRREGNSNFSINGFVNDTYVYNRALTYQEVIDIYDVYSTDFLGVNEAEDLSDVQVYPNPTSSNLYLSNLKNGQNVKLIDVSGKVVLEEIADSSEMEINVNSFKNGMYVVQIQNELNTCQKKLVINY